MPRFEPECIDVMDFLDCLDIRNVTKATETEVKFSCPYTSHSKGDESPSCYMNLNSTVYFCQSCHARGTAINFTSDILKISPLEAIRLLKQRYSASGIDPDSRCMVEEIRAILKKPKPEKRVNEVITRSQYEYLLVEWDRVDRSLPWASYILGRGFTPYTLNVWGFGYHERYNRITNLIRDHKGFVVGIKARALTDRKPKYLNLADPQHGINAFLKNEVVFGLFEAGLHGHQEFVICEGEYNVVMAHQHGFTNFIGINGSYFGETQVKLIKEFANSVTLFFDSDTAGRDATEALGAVLNPHMPVFVVPDHHGDPASMQPNEIRDCLGDRISFARRRVLARS